MNYILVIIFLLIGLLLGLSITLLLFNNKIKDYSTKITKLEVLLNEKEINIKEKEKIIEKFEITIKNLESENLIANKKISEYEGLIKEKEKTEEQSLSRLKEQEIKIENKEKEIILLKEKIANLTTENQNISKLLKEKAEEIKQMYETLKIEFENLSNKLLEEKAKKFTEHNKEIIQQSISPIKEYLERLKDLEKKVQTYYDNENKERASLKTIIETLTKKSEELEKASDQLAKALTKDIKSQGTWGELVLEKILELSGLVKGIHYHTQVKVEDKQPDVIINLPGERIIIIDSKVSLNAYINYTAATTDEERKKYLDDLNKSLQNHIKNLAGKNYETIFHGKSIDYVIMFVPVEPVMNIITSHYPDIFKDAINNKILIVTPSSLLVSLKTIHFLWKQDEARKNFEEILSNISNLHEKLLKFLEHFENIEKSLLKSIDSYKEARNTLVNGKGNVISIIKNKIEPYINAKKQLPNTWNNLLNSKED
ncbi:MAG: DNA recombination protein RmuC [Bacteroidales bacterium]|nr:DNA recombination protein RmuC [Bacteroidales bacterium]